MISSRVHLQRLRLRYRKKLFATLTLDYHSDYGRERNPKSRGILVSLEMTSFFSAHDHRNSGRSGGVGKPMRGRALTTTSDRVQL
jgi:hypothetical protein